MSGEPENLVLVHLREMRAEQRELRAEIAARFDHVEGRLDRVEERLDQMHANGVKALKQFIGHRYMSERGVGALVEDVTVAQRDIEALKTRVDRLEAPRA